MSTMPDGALEVILGVDTHELEHVAAVIDGRGRLLGTGAFPANRAGFVELLAWTRSWGRVGQAGVEGTGSFGVNLTRFLVEQGLDVVEVTRPNRRSRRHLGKSDPLDAEVAARAVLSGEATAVPKSREGIVESIRVLHVARRSAIKARTQTGQQIRSLIITAPSEIHDELASLRLDEQINRCRRFRVGTSRITLAATKRALRTLATRWAALDHEVRELDRDLNALTRMAAPRLLAQPGIGTETAARLLILASDNPERLRSDAALAALCGASPVEASSGKTKRHRVNHGGDRQGNNALWTIANNRLIHHPETRAYATRRTAQGLSRKEILRCIMRALARRLYPLLTADLTDAATLDLT